MQCTMQIWFSQLVCLVECLGIPNSNLAEVLGGGEDVGKLC